MKKKIVIALLFLVLATTLCYGAINTLDSSGLITTTSMLNRINNMFFIESDNASNIIDNLGSDRIIKIPEGVYTFDSVTGRLELNSSNSGITFEGVGDVTILVDSSLASEAWTSGQSESDETALSSNAPNGSLTINVADASNYVTGDLVLLKSNKNLSNARQGETLIVHNVTGNVIRFTEPIYFEYLTSDNANISRLHGAKHLTFENIKFNGTDSLDGIHQGMVIRAVHDLKIKNCEFNNLGYAGLGLYNVHTAIIEDVKTNNIRYQLGVDGYGIYVSSGSKNVKIKNADFRHSQEGFDCGSTSEGVPVDIVVENSECNDVIDVCLDSHDMCYDVDFVNNDIHGGNMGIRLNGRNMEATFNEIDRTNAVGIYVASVNANKTLIMGNIIKNSEQGSGIDILSSEHTSVFNNYFENFDLALRGVYNPKKLIVKNNIFINGNTGINISSGYGICSSNLYEDVIVETVNDCYEDARLSSLTVDGSVCVGKETCSEEVEVHGVDAVKVKVNSSNAYGMIELWGAEGQSTYLTAYPDEKDDATDQIQIRFNDGGDIEFKNNGGVVHNFEYDGDYYATGSVYALGTYISLNDQTPSQEVHFEINDNAGAEANANSNCDIIIEDNTNTGIQALIGRTNRFWFMVGDEDAGYPFYWYYDNNVNKYVVRVNNSDAFSIDSTYKLKHDGEVEFTGISGDGTDKCVCIKADGNLGTCDCASCSCS